MAEVASTKKKFFKKTGYALQGQRAGLASMKSRQGRDKLTRTMRRQVQALITKETELKAYDTTSAYAQIDRGGQLTALSNIVQGMVQGDRVGDELRQKYCVLNLDAYYNASAISTDVGHKLRVILFRWKNDTAAQAPTLGAILAQTASIIVTCAQHNYTDKEEAIFTVLFDKSYALNHSSDVVIRERINLYNVKQTFQPGLTTGTNQLYLLLVGDDATGAHVPDVQAQWICRFCYSDS